MKRLFFVFIFILLGYGKALADENSFAPHLLNLRVLGDENIVRLIGVFDYKPDYKFSFLDTPQRLVIDLKKTKFTLDSAPIVSGFVKNIRCMSSSLQPRVVLTMDTGFSILSHQIQQVDANSWQLIVDLQKASSDVFEKLVADSVKANASIAMTIPHKSAATVQTNAPAIDRIFRVVLDPGHGGIDSGAKGVGGVLEKNVTLAFARALRDVLQQKPGLAVSLTRDEDVFIPLADRVEKARAFGANLFISIHADTINVPDLRGATVYTLSNTASDQVARHLAESQNSVDFIGGVTPTEPKDITDILIDLTRKETHTFSVVFANKVIANLSASHVNLIKNPHRAAGFRVLKAPDIPSVLIELGYLSNSMDEQLVNDPKWRDKIAHAIAGAIVNFARYRSNIDS